MRRLISFSLIVVVISIFLVGCTSKTINVVSREDGSGTKAAFIEIVGILEKNPEGVGIDRTYDEAVVQNGTNAVMTTVAGDISSIGYISLGSLNDTVKALTIEGKEVSHKNVQDGSYRIIRPFNLAFRKDLSSLGNDFLNFILSADGQSIVVNENYVQVDTDLLDYKGGNQVGSLVIAGSTSISPVMEKLAEAYEKLNPDVSIEIQSTGSSAGVQSAIEGNVDIGMASRELKDSEKEKLSYHVIAIDAIAIIVNKDNTLVDMNLEDVKSIYIGETTTWDQIEE